MSDGEDMTGTDGHQNGKHRVVTVDQEWPLFTVDGNTATKPASAGDQTPDVTAVLRDVLGWRPIPQDPKAFVAALNASFELTEVEGHVQSRYRARGFSMQADLGAVSGGQASLYARAKSGLTHMLELLEGLTPLRPDFDLEDGAAARALVRTELNRIVAEVGMTGGPRTPLVDSSFVVVLGANTAGALPGQLDELTGDSVGGQLGRLRDVFGLVDAHVNTIEEERVRTSYWTLVDEVLDLRRAWVIWSTVLSGGTTGGFLGTDLVLLSRLMEAASEQVDEYEDILDSVLIGGADRQTIWLNFEKGLTLQGLLDWTRQFLRVDGPAYLNDSGRDGLESAYLPTVRQLESVYKDELTGPLADDPSQFPPGVSAARSRLALTSLVEIIHQLAETTKGSVPDTRPKPLEVEFRPLGTDRSTSDNLAEATKDLAAAKAHQKDVAVAVERAAILERHADGAAAGIKEDLPTVQQKFDKAVAKAAGGSSPPARAAGKQEAEATAPNLQALEAAQRAKATLKAAQARSAEADHAVQEAQRRVDEVKAKPADTRTILVTVRVENLVPGLVPVFSDGTDWIVPVRGSVTENDDSVSARFVIEPPAPDLGFLTTLDRPVTLGPEQVPLALLDGGSGEVVVPPPEQRVWPPNALGTWPVHQRGTAGTSAAVRAPRYRDHFGGDRSGDNGF